MGLKQAEYTAEEKALGLDSVHDTDKMIDEYFSKKSDKKKIVLSSDTEQKDEDVPALLKISTFGFKNGELVHNMPCPICLEKRARFVSGDFRNYFAPCRDCADEGYLIVNRASERKGWFS